MNKQGKTLTAGDAPAAAALAISVEPSKASPPRRAERKPGGAQTVLRALEILRLLARQHDAGSELSELIMATGLERTTAYRLASTLVQSGFAERDARKRYRLGIESMQLGLAAMSRAPVLDACRPAMQAIARQTEDTVYLVVRNGDYVHALHRVEGAFPIRTLTTIVGSLRPLGLGTGGQALLAMLPDEEIEALHKRHAKEFELRGLSSLKLHQAMQRTRRAGHSDTDGIVTPGVGGVGVAFATTADSHAAISVAAIEQRMTSERRAWIARVIAQEVKRIGFTPVEWR